jgi:large subunit ribosomal protein L4e
MSTKTKIRGIDGMEAGTIDLPNVFNTPFRPEVIHRVYVNLLSHSFKRQGRHQSAGEMVSAESRNTGLGIARIARARGEGFPRAGQAAGVAGVRHGRVAHPPEPWKNIYKKINKKEKQLSLCSAIAATARKDLIEKRGHKIEDIVSFPIVVSNDIESISKTKDLQKILVTLGLGKDLARASMSSKARSGTARRRGRQSRFGIGALIVVRNDEKVVKLSGSIPGVMVKPVKKLSVMDFVPGSKPIRLTIFSQNAIEQLKNIKAPIHKVMELTQNK